MFIKKDNLVLKNGRRLFVKKIMFSKVLVVMCDFYSEFGLIKVRLVFILKIIKRFILVLI